MGLERTDFFDFASSLGPGLLHAYRLGHILDLSGNSVTATVNGTPIWDANSRGYALQCRNGGLDMGDPASCRASASLTLLAFGNFTRLEPSSGRIISKRDGAAAATCDYDFFLTNTPDLNLFDGVTTSTLAQDYRDSTNVGLTVVDGAAPNFYVDGAPVGAGGNVIDVDDDGNTLRVGEREGNNNRLISPLDCVLIYINQVLTGEEISDLYRMWRQVGPIGRAAPQRPIWFLEDAPPNVSATMTENYPMNLDLDGESKGTQGNSVLTETGPVSGAPGLVNGRALEGRQDRDSRLEASNPATLFDEDNGAFEVIVTLTTDVDTGYINTSNANNRSRLYFAAGASQHWRWQKGNPAVNVNSPNNSARVEHPAHLIGTWWNDAGTRRMELFLDGESIGTNTFLDTTAPTYLRIFYISAGNSYSGRIHLNRIYSTRVTAADARILYLQYAVQPNIIVPRFLFPISLANVSSGNVGPWQRGSGTWQWVDDGTYRGLSNTVAAGWASLFESQAYGGYYFRLTKGADANTVRYMFIAAARATVADASQDGYTLDVLNNESLRLRRIDGGVLTNLITTGVGYIANNTEYEFFIARRSRDSQFSMYIRGGAYAVWTLVGTATDATYTASNYTIADFDAGDRISDFRLYSLGGTIDPTAGDLDFLDQV